MIRWRVAVSTIAPALALTLSLAASLPGSAAQPLPAQPPAPPPAPPPVTAAPPPDLAFTMKDGTILPARQWLPNAATPWRGIILALHGFSDSRDAWEYPAPGFAADGYAVFAPDQRGFGATATRGTWAGTKTMVDDAATIAAQLRTSYPSKRLIVMGESMGGAIALILAARPTPSSGARAADATILLAPAVWSRAEMGTALSTALAIANSVAPNWVLSGSQVPKDIAASDNRDALIRLYEDPLTQRASSVHVLSGLVDLMDAAQQAAPNIQGPTLILDGRRDQVIPPPATAALWKKLPPTVRRAFYLSGYHLLLRDQDRALVEADILSWLDTPEAWLPSAADINAATWTADQAYARDPTPLPAHLLDGAGLRRVWPY